MTEEKEEVATPLSPMLEETEVATDDFQFQKTLQGYEDAQWVSL